jgi:hypothetical protein
MVQMVIQPKLVVAVLVVRLIMLELAQRVVTVDFQVVAVAVVVLEPTLVVQVAQVAQER